MERLMLWVLISMGYTTTAFWLCMAGLLALTLFLVYVVYK